MASIITLKRRIKAAQNVSKTTKAMQMIAASKLKKAQAAALATRPYTEKLMYLSRGAISRIEDKSLHPYMKQHATSGKTLLVGISPDKGLCGGLITNLMREFFSYQQKNVESSYIVVGKKIEAQVTKLQKEVIASFVFGTITPTFDMVYPIVRLINEYYVHEKVDSASILSAHFTSLFSQKPKITSLLPITLPEDTKSQKDTSLYLFEPSAAEIVGPLLTHYIEIVLYQALLESFVSEQAARMIAMQNATDNANDMIEDLRLEYNKSRQAKITSEILDITSGSLAN